MAGFGWQELLIIAVIVILIFGVGKVADVGPALGKAIRGFRDAVREDDEETTSSTDTVEKEI
ncbi:MAG: twin-arginine translocase TatA/TatE family subunit [Anaerolineae bacterium]|nr:twin-arginine translocase TatA/TatE family subunit [Anaerolineae bacterium]